MMHQSLTDLGAWLSAAPKRECRVGPNTDGGKIVGWCCELSEDSEYVGVADMEPTVADALAGALEDARPET